MNLEDQITSLEISKRLKELGVKQESLWMWRKYSLCDGPKLFLSPSKGTELAVLSGKLEYEYRAFTVAELGEMLPMELKTEIYFETTRYAKGRWMVTYRKREAGHPFILTEEATEANARGKMLIYLLENKLL